MKSSWNGSGRSIGIWGKSAHIDGYASTIAPNGEKWLVLQESVIGLDGNVVKWKFVFPMDNQYVKRFWEHGLKARWEGRFITCR